MAYARSGPTSEILELQQEITREVNADAEHLARAVFGNKAKMPDMERVDDETLTARYRHAYQTQDRKWLIGEAQRDPEQFVKVARKIGVMLPEEAPQPLPTAAPLPPTALPAPIPPAGVVSPMPGPVAMPPSLPPPISGGVVMPPTPNVGAPRPVLYGPDGQPLV